MKPIAGLNGGESLPQNPLAPDKVVKDDNNSVFIIKYDTDKKGNYGEVTASELGIDSKLNEAIKTLDGITNVQNGFVARTIGNLKRMAIALLNGIVKYDTKDANTIDAAMSDCHQRITDAYNISNVVGEMKEDVNKGISSFERQTFNSKAAIEALDDPEHNEKAASLLNSDPKVRREEALMKSIDEAFNQLMDEALKNGTELDKTKIRALDSAAISDIELSYEDVAVSNKLEGEYRNEKGQQVIFCDERVYTLTFKIDGVVKTIQKTVPLPEDKRGEGFIRTKEEHGVQDEGINVNNNSHRRIVGGYY